VTRQKKDNSNFRINHRAVVRLQAVLLPVYIFFGIISPEAVLLAVFVTPIFSAFFLLTYDWGEVDLGQSIAIGVLGGVMNSAIAIGVSAVMSLIMASNSLATTNISSVGDPLGVLPGAGLVLGYLGLLGVALILGIAVGGTYWLIENHSPKGKKRFV
jgi:hypothetical protein